jgi:uncharacterized membrane protein
MNAGMALPIKLFRRHPRTWLALAVGVAVASLLPSQWPFVNRLLLGWDGAVVFFLAAICVWMSRLTADQLLAHYIEDDPSGPALLIIVTAAALLSLVATVEVLATLRHFEHRVQLWHSLLAAVTLIESWLLVPTMFTMHYADMFYSALPADRPLSFPQTERPLFWDFAYFSFTIAAASQTADVLTTRLSIRKVVLVHEIVSFVFNASILGFAINVTAGLIGS